MDTSIQWLLVSLTIVDFQFCNFGEYLGLGILLKLIIDGKSVIGVNLNEWALELFFILKGT